MNWYKTLTLTAKYMIAALGGLFLLLLLLGIIIIYAVYPFESSFSFAFGLFTGCLVSGVRVVLMDNAINKSVAMEEKRAKNYYRLQVMARQFLVLGYAGLLVIFHKYLGVYGGVAGLLCLQLSAYITNFALNKKDKKKQDSDHEHFTDGD